MLYSWGDLHDDVLAVKAKKTKVFAQQTVGQRRSNNDESWQTKETSQKEIAYLPEIYDSFGSEPSHK